MRVGHGYDVHAFGGSKPLILGGVEFENHQGLLAHSDGDVLTHAICDALLGAIGEGDIGRHFPDTDPDFAGVDSMQLLQHVLSLVTDHGFEIANVDVTVIAQTPRMAAKIGAIKSKLSGQMKIDESQLNIKATTTEKLGYIGRKEGIAVHSVALLTAVNQ